MRLALRSGRELKLEIARHAGLLRNSGFNLGGHAVTVAAALICIPVAFREFGPERFGLLTLVWSMLSYAIVFDFGTGPAVARATASSIVSDEGRRIAAILRAGMTIQIVLGIIGALLLAGFAAELLQLLKVPQVWQPDATRALYLLALALPVVLIAQSQQAVLEGLERFDLIAYLRTPVAVATYAIPAIGAVAGWSLARIVFGLFAARLLAMIAMHVLVRANLPASQSGVLTKELPGLFRYGRWLAISGVLTQLLVYLDRFLLSALHGLSAVAQYAAPYDAAAKLLLLPGSIGVAMFPGLAKDAARGGIDEAVARCRAAANLTMVVLIPICLALIVFAGPILHLWLGPQLRPEGVAAFRILLLATLFNAAAYPPVILIDAVGRPDAVARYNLVALVVYLPAVLFAVWRFGVVGAAWAWVAHTAGLMLWSLWYARRWVRRARIANHA